MLQRKVLKGGAPWKNDRERYKFLLENIPLREEDILQDIQSGKLGYVQLRHFFFDASIENNKKK